MPARQVVVIAGGGLAGAKAAEALRSRVSTAGSCWSPRRTSAPTSGRRCPRTTCRARPSRDTIFVHPADWYDANDVELLLGTAVTGSTAAAAR